eukprot:9069012-Pyramimonas_sp.AAC.1
MIGCIMFVFWSSAICCAVRIPPTEEEAADDVAAAGCGVGVPSQIRPLKSASTILSSSPSCCLTWCLRLGCSLAGCKSPSLFAPGLADGRCGIWEGGGGPVANHGTNVPPLPVPLACCAACCCIHICMSC